MTTRQDVLNTKHQASVALHKVRRANLREYHELSIDWHRASVELIDGALEQAEESFIDIVMDSHSVIADDTEAK